jgi:hypothetical protein
MTYPNEPFGQYMLSKAPDKLCMAQSHRLFETILAVIFIGKSNTSLIHLLDTMIADGDFVRVPSQIFHHNFGISEWFFRKNNPVFLKKCLSYRFINLQLLAQISYIFCSKNFT